MLGFQFCGLYVGSETVERDGKTKYYVLLSVGASAFRFSVPLEVYTACSVHALGDVVRLLNVSASAFNGRVYYSAVNAEWGEV